MKKKFKIIGYALLFFTGAFIAISIVNYQNAQVEVEKHRLMCARADIRLIRLGWIDCGGE